MIIALKGAIGSGKSTVARSLEHRGFKIVICDKIVHDMYQNNQTLIKQINDHFKLGDNLEVDRKALGQIVFNDQEKLKELEAMVHPLLKFEMLKQIGQSEKVIIDCQIVDKLEINYDLSLLLYASEAETIKRIKARDNKDEATIKKIMQMQMQKHRLTTRTYSINTTEGFESIKEQISKIKELKND